MHFYLKTDKNGKPVTTGKNQDSLIYMRQYGGENTRFDNGTFIISTGERIKPNLWDYEKNYPKPSQTSVIFNIENLRLETIGFLNTNKQNKIVTTTGLLRDQINPAPEAPEAKVDTLLSYWDQKLAAKPKTSRTMTHQDSELSGRNAFSRWLTYKKGLWTADQSNSKLPVKERDRHLIPGDPREFTQTMFDEYIKFMREGETGGKTKKKSYNSIMAYSGDFKALCVWIFNRKEIRVGFKYENIETTMKGSRKGKLMLSLEAVVKIENLKVTKRLEYLRDMMMLQIWVGCRVSDLFRIAENTDKKTGVCNMELTKRVDRGSGKRIIQKLLSPAWDIIKKYNYITPELARDPFNDGIREIIKEVDPETTVQIRNEQTGEFETMFLYEVYSSHDNIRTCVSIAEQHGIPASSIANNVGKTRQTLEEHYLTTNQKVATVDWGLFEEKVMAAKKKIGKKVR